MKHSKTDPCYVYVMHDPIRPDWSKVGLSYAPETRLFDLQCGNPFLQLHDYWKLSTRLRAYRCEQMSHDSLSTMFSRKREFFNCPPEIATMHVEGVMEELSNYYATHEVTLEDDEKWVVQRKKEKGFEYGS